MSALNQNVTNCSFKIDQELNIISADNDFYRYINETKVNSLYPYIDDEDVITIKNALNSNASYCAINFNVRERKFFCILQFEKSESYYNVNLLESTHLLNDYNKQLKKNNLYYELIHALNLNYFIFDIKTKMYTVVNTNSKGNSLKFDIKQMIEYINEKFNIDINDIKLDYFKNNNEYNDFLSTAHKGTYPIRTKDNTRIEFGVIPIINDNYERTETIVIVQFPDQESKIQISHNNDIDGQTNLLNKNAIIEYAINKIEVSKRTTTLIIIDIDDFKTINDTYGHQFGDDVIISFANVLKKEVGHRGKVGRFGGDEFLIVIDDTDDEIVIRDIARNIRLGVQWSYVTSHPDFIITCSMGIASYPKDEQNFESLFEAADSCLYRAKSKGKDCYVIYLAHKHQGLRFEKTNLNLDKYTTMYQDIFVEYNIMNSIEKDSLVDVMKLLFDVYKFNRITIYDKKMNVIYLNGDDMENARKEVLKSDDYFKYHNASGILVNDNINKYEVVNKERFRMYYQYKLASTLEIIINNSESNLGFICFDYFKPSRAWEDKTVKFLILVCQLLAKKY